MRCDAAQVKQPAGIRAGQTEDEEEKPEMASGGFQIPQMNLTATIWRNYGPPYLPRPAGGADTACNLRGPGHGNPTIPATGQQVLTALLLPGGTDVRGTLGFGGGADIVECPKGSGRFYQVYLVEDIGKGFPNEYRTAYMNQLPLQVAFPIP